MSAEADFSFTACNYALLSAPPAVWTSSLIIRLLSQIKLH